MSSGGAGHAGHEPDDCAKVLARMFFFIDNELAEADLSEIRRHLDECAPCLARYDLERTVKDLVIRSCNERAPESLRQRVLVQIREVHLRLRD